MDPEPLSFYSLTFDLQDQTIIGCIILIILLVCSALISGVEVALFSLSKTQIDEAESAEKKYVNSVKKLLEKPKKLLATILVANNFINIAIVLLFDFLSEIWLGHISSPKLLFLLKVVLVTFLILLFGEILPKV